MNFASSQSCDTVSAKSCQTSSSSRSSATPFCTSSRSSVRPLSRTLVAATARTTNSRRTRLITRRNRLRICKVPMPLYRSPPVTSLARLAPMATCRLRSRLERDLWQGPSKSSKILIQLASLTMCSRSLRRSNRTEKLDEVVKRLLLARHRLKRSDMGLLETIRINLRMP